ncbi:MAG: IS1595 family transposase [Proteobacteria bacterium]|nr:IS1595 family transposase [Pseudomonadota bacterium]
MHSTKLRLSTWIEAMYLVTTSSKGISSVILSRLIGTTQATAWRLGHAIREMMKDLNAEPLSGIVEIDIKYLCGRPKRRKDGAPSKRGRGSKKPKILIAVARDDRMHAVTLPSESGDDIEAALSGVISPTATLMSDRERGFLNAAKALVDDHQTVVHSAGEHVRGEVHSNTAEGVGSMLERARLGVWHRMSQAHLQRYLDEISFRWNCRIKREITSRRGRKRRIITTISLPDMLSRMLRPCLGRQIRRTPNYGLRVLPNHLASPLSFRSDLSIPGKGD